MERLIGGISHGYKYLFDVFVVYPMVSSGETK